MNQVESAMWAIAKISKTIRTVKIIAGILFIIGLSFGYFGKSIVAFFVSGFGFGGAIFEYLKARFIEKLVENMLKSVTKSGTESVTKV